MVELPSCKFVQCQGRENLMKSLIWHLSEAGTHCSRKETFRRRGLTLDSVQGRFEQLTSFWTLILGHNFNMTIWCSLVMQRLLPQVYGMCIRRNHMRRPLQPLHLLLGLNWCSSSPQAANHMDVDQITKHGEVDTKGRLSYRCMFNGRNDPQFNLQPRIWALWTQDGLHVMLRIQLWTLAFYWIIVY